METNANVSDDLAKDLKKKRFFEISDEVSNGLNKNKVDADQILESDSDIAEGKKRDAREFLSEL